MTYAATHFIGIRPGTDRWWQAVRVFGKPDFIHLKWDQRAYYGGEIDWENDRLIFGGKERQDVVHSFSVDDSNADIPSDARLMEMGL
jgi:hypothetical protein